MANENDALERRREDQRWIVDGAKTNGGKETILMNFPQADFRSVDAIMRTKITEKRPQRCFILDERKEKRFSLISFCVIFKRFSVLI